MRKLLSILLVQGLLAAGDCRKRQRDNSYKCSAGLNNPTAAFLSGAAAMFSSRGKTPAEPTFLYFSREKDHDPSFVTLANSSSWDPDFDPTIKTAFIIRGYRDGNESWTRELKDALLLREDCNVFIVEWDRTGTYRETFKNIPEVGKQVSLFIRELMAAKGLNLRSLHIIGLGVGAHVAGFAGKEIRKREKRSVGRITGLDPAGQGFYYATPNQRLNATDAEFVDVIHTNGACSIFLGLGLSDPIGHFDFYPNGGKNQPGCLNMSEFYGKTDSGTVRPFLSVFGSNFIPELQLCSHVRSRQLFTASVFNNSCEFLSVRCSSWERFQSGLCDANQEVLMGYDADRFKDSVGPGDFYLSTTQEPPFCITEPRN